MEFQQLTKAPNNHLLKRQNPKITIILILNTNLLAIEKTETCSKLIIPNLYRQKQYKIGNFKNLKISQIFR